MNSSIFNKAIKILTVAYITIITYFSLTPDISTSKFPISDKFLHSLEYLIFIILLLLSYKTKKLKFKKRVSYLIIPIIYGILIEFIQFFLESRSFEVLDIIFNIIGVGAGFCFYELFLFINKKD